MSIKITLQGKEKLIRGFDNVESGLSSFLQPMKRSSDMLMSQFDKNFPAKGALLGNRWQKRKRNYPHPILQKSGKMRKGFRDRVLPMRAEITNPVAYFRYHQLGTRQLPVRLMMKITDQKEKEIMDIFNNYVKKVTNDFG